MKLALLAIAACSSPTTPHATPLWSDGTHLRDDHGRIALLRGVNARVQGVFDVTFDDGRVALEPIPPLTDAECLHMYDLGLDFLRLPMQTRPLFGTLEHARTLARYDRHGSIPEPR